MWTLTWKGLAAHKLRFALTGLAVVLGTAFVAGALTFGDTLEEGFEDLFTSVVGTADAVVRPDDAPAPGTAGDPTAGGGPGDGLPPELVDDLAALDEVGMASGEIQGTAVLVDADGEPIGQFGPPTLAYNVFEHPELDPAELREGRWPTESGEVAVDAGTVAGQDWEVGDEVSLVVDGPVETAELVGTFGIGELDNLAGASVVIFDADTALDRLGDDGDYTRIYLGAADGVGEDALFDALDDALADRDVEVLTSAEIAEEEQAAVAPFVELFSTVLLVFAVVALLVGGFLIFNTFTIVLAGRLREFALLRAVGASRGQLLRAVLGEAVLVGLIGGALGALLGVAVAFGLRELLGVVGVELPGTGLVVAPRTVAVAVGVGAAITLVAALVPARRAVRVPPVAALTEVAVAAPAGRGIVRTVVGLVLVAAGAAGMAATLVGDVGAVALGAGSVAVFLGVAALSPLIVRPLVGVLGWPAARAGVRGQLARANARRNPRRTAATASALMIGLALVAFVSIFAASLEATIARTIDRSFQVDAMVRAGTAGGVPDSVTDVLADVDEVAVAAPTRGTQIEVGEGNPFAAVMDADDLRTVFDLDVVDGDLADFGDGAVVVTEAAADNRDLAAGDDVTIGVGGEDVDVTVAATVDGSGLDMSWFLDRATFDAAGGSAPVFNVYVQLADGVGADAGLTAVEDALVDYPQVTVLDEASLAETIGEQLDQLLGVVVALLALSVIIALLGIVNTLALSVVERTREIGLLRAVGMTRPQVRGMIRGEALLVALIGAALGLALGVAFGAAFVSVDEFNLDTFALPWVQLAVGVVVAAVAGLLAGVLPARRAARLDVLDALRTE